MVGFLDKLEPSVMEYKQGWHIDISWYRILADMGYISKTDISPRGGTPEVNRQGGQHFEKKNYP